MKASLISLFLIQSEEWRQYCWYYPQYSGYMLMLHCLYIPYEGDIASYCVFFDFDFDGRGSNLRCILVDIHSELVNLRPLLCYFATLLLSRHISIEDQKIIFWGPLQVILGHFENWVVHFFISLIIFCLGVPVRAISLEAYFICPKLCLNSIWLI